MPRRMNTLSFRGGYRFRGFQGVPTDQIAEIPPGQTAAIPLHVTQSAKVSPGDQVTVGQIIGDTDGSPRRVTISPVSGSVSTVSPDLIEVECTGDQSWSPVAGASADWGTLSVDTIEDILLATGCSGAIATGLPTRHATAALAPVEVRRVVVHDSGAEVYKTSVKALMDGRDAGHLLDGLSILKKLYPHAEIHLVLGDEAKAEFQDLASRAVSSDGLSVHTGSAKYPQNNPYVLMGSIFGDRIAADAVNQDADKAVVMDLQALLQVRDAVVTGKPAIDRVVALAGPGFTATQHVRVRVGTPVQAVIAGYLGEGQSPRLVWNSVMTGEQVGDVSEPVGTGATALIAVPQAAPEFIPFIAVGARRDSFSSTFLSSIVKLPKTLDDNLHGETRACIGCGYCEAICPAGILPFIL
ncbi:MAG: hypothetical protein E4H09_02375, partial [Spirochaetales bacterium]